MNKIRMTKTALKYDKIYRIGYCELQKILKSLSAVGYNAGVYGWNYDVYCLGENVILITGYRTDCGIKISHEICDKILKDYAARAFSDVEGFLRSELKKYTSEF